MGSAWVVRLPLPLLPLPGVVRRLFLKQGKKTDGSKPKKRRLSGGGSGSHLETSPEEKTKKCSRCKKPKPVSDFYAGKASCKSCAKDLKNLENQAKSAKETEWYKSLDEKEVDALLAAYNKERDRAAKERSKVKFSITYKERLIHSAGLRKEGRRRLMTESAYIAWARSVEGGSLTANQADEKWKEMCSDPSVPTEGEGTSLKVAVKIYDDIIDYDDVAKEREIERSQKLGNKMTSAQLAQKQADLVLSSHSATDVEMKQAATALSGSGMVAEGVMVGSLSELQKKKKAAVKDESDDDAAGDEEEKEEEKDEKWFDAMAESARAKRQSLVTLAKKHTAMSGLVTQMKEVQDNARAAAASSGDTPNFVVEMRILDTRLRALELVASGKALEYKDFVLEILQRKQGDAENKSQASNGTGNDARLAYLGLDVCFFSSGVGVLELTCHFK